VFWTIGRELMVIIRQAGHLVISRSLSMTDGQPDRYDDFLVLIRQGVLVPFAPLPLCKLRDLREPGEVSQLSAVRSREIQARIWPGSQGRSRLGCSALRCVVAAMIMLPMRTSSRYSASSFPTTSTQQRKFGRRTSRSGLTIYKYI
jgi:hypothetical protein